MDPGRDWLETDPTPGFNLKTGLIFSVPDSNIKTVSGSNLTNKKLDPEPKLLYKKTGSTKASESGIANLALLKNRIQPLNNGFGSATLRES